jgi:Uma2 family endonuclease
MSIHESSLFPGGVFPPAPGVHRLSVEQYHKMIETGVLSDDDRVELIDGLILEMSPIGSPHAYVVQELIHVLWGLTAGMWEAFPQQPVTLGTSEPVPDMTVARGTNADYKDHHPGPGEIGLIIEVADSSVELDRRVKSQVYAAAGVPEYWIVNLPERQIEVHRDPRAMDSGTAAYQSREVVPATGKVEVILDGRRFGEIAVAAILP